VLLPKLEEYTKVYDSIRESIKLAKLKLIVPEKFQLNDYRFSIIESIKQSDIIIADISTTNPNVFYELGLAHAFGKQTILLSRKNSTIPFDLADSRIILYKPDPQGLFELRGWLSNTLRLIVMNEEHYNLHSGVSRIRMRKKVGDATSLHTKQRKKINYLIKKASVAKEKAQFSKAASILEEALEKSESSDKQYSLILNNLGSVNQAKGEYDKALSYYQKALSISINSENINGTIASYNNLASTFERVGQLSQAEELYLRALELNEKNEDSQTKGKILQNLGALCQKMNRFEQSIKYYKAAEKIFKDQKNDQLLAQTYNNWAVLLLQERNFASAERLFLKASELFGNKNDFALSSIWHNVAYIKFEKGQLDDAKKYLEKSISAKKDVGDQLGEASSITLLSQIKIKEDALSEAFDLLKTAAKIQEQIGDKRGLIDTFETLSFLSSKVGNIKEAKLFLKMSLALADQTGDPKEAAIEKKLETAGDKKGQDAS
jgi:Tfp pilus assembly protein PilF